MKFVRGEWVNKNIINASKRYERKWNEVPNGRKARREWERLFPNK